MKISKVIVTDPRTQEKQIFTFGTAIDEKAVVTTNGTRLNSYLEFCFNEDTTNVCDVEVAFEINQEQYRVRRTHREDGLHSVFEKFSDGEWKVIAYTNIAQRIEELINEQLSDMLKTDYVSNVAVDNFHGDLKLFDQIRMLAEVEQSVIQSSDNARSMKENALRKVEQYALSAKPSASASDLSAVNDELETINRELSQATAQMGELKAKQTGDPIRGDIARELEIAQQKYNDLTAKQSQMEEIRAKIKQRDELAEVLPKVKTLKTLSEQRAEYEKQRYELTSELEWKEKELATATEQLQEKQRQYASTQDKRSRIDAINTEMAYVSSLYEKNRELNETLLGLNDKLQQLTSEKVMYTNKLDSVEKSIGEVKNSLDAFNIPSRSVGEMLETVRVDIKIDEVTAQIEKLQSEIAIKESQIAEKESNLVTQVKRFRSIAELDSAVTPVKAKDTILQVLESKHSKLESINTALHEKIRNLERAAQGYKERLDSIDGSKRILQAELEQSAVVKQEEFKRDVFLANSDVFDDATAVKAVTTELHDVAMETLEKDIASRDMDRDLILERLYQIRGAIKEIKRHIEINNAEMESLQREKANINRRYDELVSQNRSEAVYSYITALNNDSGTQYLLEVQQEAVRSEAELTELKRYTEGLRANLSSLNARLRNLRDSQQKLDSASTSVDSLVSTNDKLKDDLSDIGDRLSACYEQYKAVSKQLEEIDAKIDDVRASIVECSKTIKVNEAKIAESTEKAKKYAGSDDVEGAVAGFKYEMGDIESEYQMLTESQAAVEKDVFAKRLEMEKIQWLYDSKSAEHDKLQQELQVELSAMGMTLERVESMNIDGNLDAERKELAEYDAEKTSLAEKIDNLYGLVRNQSEGGDASIEELGKKQAEIVKLQERQAQLEEQRKVLLDSYVSGNTAKMAATAAAAEARVLQNLSATIQSNEIIKLLIGDKIKSVLTTATVYLNAFTDDNYVLTVNDYKVEVLHNGVKLSYDSLSQEIKTAAYISIILSVPNTDVSEGKWLVFADNLAVNADSLSNMMQSIANVCYVVDYSKE